MKKLDFDQIYSILKLNQILSDKEREAYVYALEEIFESVDKIYNKLLPQLLKTSDNEKIKDILWDMREEFRHVQYHIEDGKLTEINEDF